MEQLIVCEPGSSTPCADYRLELKVRNNRILHYMRQMGYDSVNALCRATGLNNVAIGLLINLKMSAVNSFGIWRPQALKLAEALACEPDDLWTQAQRTAMLKTNQRAVELAEAEVSRILEKPPTPEEALLSDEFSEQLEKALNSLTPREEDVLRMRFGLSPYYREHTQNDVSAVLGLSTSRIAQIEALALRKMRHPNKHHLLEYTQ